MPMVIIGIDSHKRSHTAVAIDEAGRQLAVKTVEAVTEGHLALLAWAAGHYPERRFAQEDCRNLSRQLERDLLGAGESVVRVPPKLMGVARRSGREPGKSDPIDALAVARAALREPDLPVARLDGPERELRLLVDRREDLVATRIREINRLRWRLHEIDPGTEPPRRGCHRRPVLDALATRLAGIPGLVARIAAELVAEIRTLTEQIDAYAREITGRVKVLAPRLLAHRGVGALTAAKLLGQAAGVLRFRSAAAFTRHDGTAPVPVWSGNDDHHRLSRGGNRQLNTAIHVIAVTRLRIDPESQAYRDKRIAGGDTPRDALRALKRRVSDDVYRLMVEDERARTASAGLPAQAA